MVKFYILMFYHKYRNKSFYKYFMSHRHFLYSKQGLILEKIIFEIKYFNSKTSEFVVFFALEFNILSI